MKELEKQREASSSSIPTVTSLPLKSHGRPLVLGKFDDQVKEYVMKLRAAGRVVNTTVVMGVMCGIILSHDRTLLYGNGGYVKITKTLALSLLRHMEFVKRKGFTSAKVIPAEYDKIRIGFLDRIREVATDFSILPSLIVNSDKTGIKINSSIRVDHGKRRIKESSHQ